MAHQSRDLRFVGIANDPGNPGEGGEFFRRALCIAASDNDFCGRILRVDFADGVASLGVGGRRHRAGVDNDDRGGGGIRGESESAIEQLAFDRRSIGLGGATAELLNVEG